MLLHLIADFGVGDPSFTEVSQKFLGLDPSLQINYVYVPKFSTLATGFWMAQLATVNPFKGLAIFSNTAPRVKVAADLSKTYKGKYGHLAYAKLTNGVPVIGVHVGFTFSFLKPLIQTFRLVNIPNEGSQFRSRDFYPQGVMQVLNGAPEALGGEIPLESIPEVPADTIAFVDGYGNIKTTVRLSQTTFVPGQQLLISLNGMKKSAFVGGETYQVEDGALCFAPGSSGGDDRFMEIWVKGGSAWEAFDKPRVEESFTLVPVE